MANAVRWKDVLLAAAVFSLASLVYTFPLITAKAHANRLDSPDALLNSWIISWNVHQLRDSFTKAGSDRACSDRSNKRGIPELS